MKDTKFDMFRTWLEKNYFKFIDDSEEAYSLNEVFSDFEEYYNIRTKEHKLKEILSQELYSFIECDPADKNMLLESLIENICRQVCNAEIFDNW